MSFSSDVVTGAAETLDAAGVGDWRPTGTYLPGERPIVRGRLPSSPDVAIALATYSVTDDPSLSDSVIGLQALSRGTTDPVVVDDLDDAIFDALHGLWSTQVATVYVVSLVRVSGVSLGTDSNQRWQRSSNFYLTCHRPSPNRT